MDEGTNGEETWIKNENTKKNNTRIIRKLPYLHYEGEGINKTLFFV
jgi:hypothetical protein